MKITSAIDTVFKQSSTESDSDYVTWRGRGGDSASWNPRMERDNYTDPPPLWVSPQLHRVLFFGGYHYDPFEEEYIRQYPHAEERHTLTPHPEGDWEHTFDKGERSWVNNHPDFTSMMENVRALHSGEDPKIRGYLELG